MRRAKRNRVPAVIREQIEGLMRERDEANDKLIKANAELIDTRDQLAFVRDCHTALSDSVNELRKMLDDTRRQRDRAQSDVENLRAALRNKELGLSRAMGWVDAKRDIPPHIEAPLEIPF